MDYQGEAGINLSDHLINYLHLSSYQLLITESILLSAVIYVVLIFTLRKKKQFWLTEEQKERILAKWKPEPLVPETPAEHPALRPHFFDGKVCKYVNYDGKDYFNLVSTNFLGLIGNETIEKEAKNAIAKYGVGSCGPRHFYGTVDVHLELEKQLADFLGCEEAVLYSCGFATVSSAIPSYAKKGDVIFADKGANFAIQKGLQASKSRIEWFDHNDLDHLEKLLMEQTDQDRRFPKLASRTRRFLVVEGLYMNSGDLCPLPQLLALKWKYKLRIFIDESLSIGVIGKTGRGITEHFGINVVDCDMIMGSLEHALSSTGGFCAGRSFVIHHQRLCGLGYCFSASLPPLLAVAASKGLEIIKNDQERLTRLHENSKMTNLGLQEALKHTGFKVSGDLLSPLQHIFYDGNAAEETLDNLVEKMRRKGYLLARARYLSEEFFASKPSIRISVQSEMTTDELYAFLTMLKKEARKVDKKASL